jgi:hypothetical protein
LKARKNEAPTEKEKVATEVPRHTQACAPFIDKIAAPVTR